MPDSRPTRSDRTGLTLPLAVAGVLFFFAAAGGVSYWNTVALRQSAKQVAHTHEVLTALDDILSYLKDAETGQRGYLITEDLEYLKPYTVALPRVKERLADLERLTADNPAQQNRLVILKTRIKDKLDELAETVDLQKNKKRGEALARVKSDDGKLVMDAARDQVREMEAEEETLRRKRLDDADAAFWVAVVSGILTGLVGVLLTAAVATLLSRAAAARRREEWLLAGESGVGVALLGDLAATKVGENALAFLAGYLDAPAGAFFTSASGRFRRDAVYGVPAGGVPEEVAADDGLIGRAVRERRALLLSDLPDGYLQIGSALGRGTPRHLIVVPAVADGVVEAVFELGFLRPPPPAAVELLGRVAEAVGVAVRSANYRLHLQNLLEESQRQGEELEAQGEELRVNNEELEEQSRVLRESQARLEQQQAELEQTNVQLEEQAQLLEQQRDSVLRAQAALAAKARELEQASKYKSDFLANMSHELRTPLNSSLILAKLLADNPTGNLTAEQVKYADTIRSAGNDLLALINDILDLSKIEAGHMDIRPEGVRVADVLDSLRRTFDPLAGVKGVRLVARAAADAPAEITTDRQRLEQVLKNLLANAVKFTDAGEVEVSVGRAAGGWVAFAVKDTGIGIPAEQQDGVFDAFRQADGGANRKYAGTGLGLSISRRLARLLGGDITLVSEPGRGSTFTVLLPAEQTADAVPLPPPPPAMFAPLPPPPAAFTTPTVARHRLPDDRDRLGDSKRVLLVVEDDEAFARILYDLAHELGFHCLLAGTAEEALADAADYRPGAVVLDVGLPDHSGLTVLDRLKQDPRTRHIPVHVVSGGDYAQTALSLGAVGYLLKPVKRDELADALRGLEGRLAHRVQRVLVVEDDAVQREALGKLLASAEVQVEGAATAAECLGKLKEATFDCMVLDLTLPDASGYSLLETLSREDAYSFPPVIVYTGRQLGADEEQRLRRYSRSIIIKGAKSPERLLDEVTLFLHRVVSDLPQEQQRMLEKARSRDAAIEGKRVLVVEDDVRNVFALTSILEPRGAVVEIARNGKEALAALDRADADPTKKIDLILMDVMMPEMDGLTATRELRKRSGGTKLPVIMLTAKAMKDDQEQCLAAGANDYLPKPLDVDKLLSLVRVWMPR